MSSDIGLDDEFQIFAGETSWQELLTVDANSGREWFSKNTRAVTSDGGLSIAWRVPSWSLPELPENLNLSSFKPLECLKERNACPKCFKSRHYYCYDCLEPLLPKEVTPKICLPFQLHILMHRNERFSMSTAIHVALLAKEQTIIHKWKAELPKFDPQSTLLLYPSKSSSSLEEIDKSKIKNIIVVESKWKGTFQLLSRPELQGIPHVRLEGGKSSYWRYHTKNVPEGAVSTVEAIHLLCREWHSDKHSNNEDCHCFDDLLWYFAFIHGLVEKQPGS